ncbi:MAG: ABC transporter ATP-binding protein [Polyangiaceae bacterium]
MAKQNKSTEIAPKSRENETTTTGSTALAAIGISARYDATTTLAVEDVSFDLKRGELMSVLGPNGAGKTTLVRALAGVQKTSAGEVRVFGRPLSEIDRRELAQMLAVVRQHENVASGFSVREVVMMGRAPHQTGWQRATHDDEKIVAEAIERMDLTELADRPARELSGGEARRVAIARAFAQRPKILLLDEPGAFLDVRHQLALYDRLAEEIAHNQLACLVVMHDLNMAAQYSDRVVILRDGKLVACGAPANVMTEDRMLEVFGARLRQGIDPKSKAPYFLPVRA